MYFYLFDNKTIFCEAKNVKKILSMSLEVTANFFILFSTTDAFKYVINNVREH